MKRIATTTAALALSLACTVKAADGLYAFQWKNRVVVIFSARVDRAADEQRGRLVSQRQALAERDMVVLHVSGDRVETVFGKADGLSAATLRRQAGLAPETRFAVVLVGKDGGIKLRETQPVTAEALFGLIDAMPMRASEMKR